MSKNKNNNQTRSLKLSRASTQIGLLLMSAAATFGILELPDHVKTPIIMPARMTPVMTNQNNNQNNNTLRREKDEIGTYYISYSESQRTPSRSGKR